MLTFIEEIKNRYPLQEHSYFKGLHDGTFSREDFIETQIQFLQAVVFFSRPMAMLAARIPRPELRWSILHNVAEEHGEGDFRQSHERTFLTLLERLGVSHEDIRKRALWPEVRAFNTTLLGVCTGDDYLIGTATMGIIEDMFAGISALLGKKLVDNGWLKEDELIHYKVHSELDIKHAADFYQILEKPYENSPQERYYIQQGLELGAYCFMQMYRGLYEARQRRSLRDITGPHSQMDGWYLPEV